MQISRRDALMGASAAVAVAGVPTAVTAQADDPLLAMEQEWLAYRDYCNNHPDESDEARGPLYERLYAMEDAIYSTPTQTPAGVAVKLRLWAHYFTHVQYPGAPWWEGDIDQMEAQDEQWLALVMRDLERLAGEARS